MSENNPLLAELLVPERVSVGMHVNSKKRLLEEIAQVFCNYQQGLDRDTVFQILFERERLGSTGIGNHVALPHGRINGLSQPLGMMATLRNPLDYDAIDQQPVSFVFGLLVPAEADEKHLNILALLARMFSDNRFVASLAKASDNVALMNIFLHWEPLRSLGTN